MMRILDLINTLLLAERTQTLKACITHYKNTFFTHLDHINTHIAHVQEYRSTNTHINFFLNKMVFVQ